MKQVAVGILLKDGLVLTCQRRSHATYPLKWEFPGGKVDPRESHEEALTRELHEELSIHATAMEEFFHQRWTYPNSGTDGNTDGTFEVTYYLVQRFEEEPVNNTFEQIRWISPADLQSMDILEGNRKAVELLTKYVQQRVGPIALVGGPNAPSPRPAGPEREPNGSG